MLAMILKMGSGPILKGQSGFSQMHNISNNANIGITGFAMWKQKIPVTKCYPSEDRTLASHNLWFQVHSLSFLS